MTLVALIVPDTAPAHTLLCRLQHALFALLVERGDLRRDHGIQSYTLSVGRCRHRPMIVVTGSREVLCGRADLRCDRLSRILNAR